MFNWEKFKNGEIAIRCNTREEINNLIIECEKEISKCFVGENARYHINKTMCHCCRKGLLTYGDTRDFKMEGKEIYEGDILQI